MALALASAFVAAPAAALALALSRALALALALASRAACAAHAWRNASQIPAAPCPNKSASSAALLQHGRIHAAYASKCVSPPLPTTHERD